MKTLRSGWPWYGISSSLGFGRLSALPQVIKLSGVGDCATPRKSFDMFENLLRFGEVGLCSTVCFDPLLKTRESFYYLTNNVIK